MSPFAFVILFGLVCVGGFLVGLRFFRMAEPPAGTTVEQVRRFGRMLMMVSTALFLFLLAALLHGDLGLIRTAKAIR